MKTIDEFFKKYKIQEFYDWQADKTSNPIIPFKKHQHKKLSFNIIPGFRNYDLFYERYLSAVDIIKAQEIVKDNIKILDIGAGEAFFKFFFDAKCKESINWQGIEVWKERAEFCEHVGYKIDKINLEKGKLPYEDSSFDIVLASHVLEHIPNPEIIIRAMNRVLKKGGILLLATPTKPPIIVQLVKLYHKLNNKHLGETQQAFTHKTLEKLILDSLNLTKKNIIDKRGFRIFSSRKKLPIENWKWFYNLQTKLGKIMLFFVPEINIIIQK